MAASIREAFGASITRILAELKTVGVLQKDVAARMDIHSAQISRWKDGMIPTADVLDEFIAVANKALPPAKRIEPSDLFGDPQRRQADFVVELARRAGYEVKKP